MKAADKSGFAEGVQDLNNQTAYSKLISDMLIHVEGQRSVPTFLESPSFGPLNQIWDCRMMSDAKGPVKAGAQLPTLQFFRGTF